MKKIMIIFIVLISSFAALKAEDNELYKLKIKIELPDTLLYIKILFYHIFVKIRFLEVFQIINWKNIMVKYLIWTQL